MSEVILFDLDGTLTDSAEGITKSVQYALEHFGIEEPDLKKLECFVGPPLKEQFMKYCKFSEKQAEVAVAVYRERYAKTGIYENKLFEGIQELLQLLKDKGKILGVASSKPTVYVKQILEYFQIEQYFDVAVGAELDGTRSDKAEVIEEALELLSMTNQRADILMVGDRKHDVEGAFQCGLQCIGVAYGYGGVRELELAGAIYIAQTVEELKILASDSSNEMGDVQPTGQKHMVKIQPPEVNIFKKIWRVLYPIGIHFGISLSVSQIATLIILGWYGIYSGQNNLDEVRSYVMKYTLTMTGVVSVIAIPILQWFYKKDSTARKKGLLGIHSVNKKHVKKGSYLATILFAITASQILNVLLAASGLYDLFPAYGELDQQVFANQPLLVSLFVVGILGPIAEELVFRGLVFKRIQDYIGTGWGIWISAVFFGIYHGNMIQFVYASLLGLVFGLLMGKTNSLKIVVVAHITANLWSVIGSGVLEFLSAKNTYVYIGYLTVFAIVSILSVVYIISKDKKKRIANIHVDKQ